MILTLTIVLTITLHLTSRLAPARPTSTREPHFTPLPMGGCPSEPVLGTNAITVTYVYVYIYIYTVCVYTYIYIYIYIYLFNMYVRISLSLYIYIYIYIYNAKSHESRELGKDARKPANAMCPASPTLPQPFHGLLVPMDFWSACAASRIMAQCREASENWSGRQCGQMERNRIYHTGYIIEYALGMVYCTVMAHCNVTPCVHLHRHSRKIASP